MSEQMQEEKRVLALKYRPHRFEDLVGQSTVSQTLSLALDSNRLSHAYLFSGLRGSGKTSTARIMAKALLCSEGPTSKPCEVCDNCISSNANRHLDVIEMDAASNRGIDDIKDLIEHTKYKPSSARFKVFIIDEVHMLTTQAFNALLKTLEEPPGFVKFILATTDPLKLPATILSRTQHFRFNKIASTDVIHHLSHILNEENIDYENDALEILSRSGQGSLRDTLTLLDQAIIFSKGKVSTLAVVDMLGLIDPVIMDNIFSIILKKEDISPIIKELESYEVSQICDEMTIYLKHKMIEKDPKFDLLLFDRFFRILSDAKHLLSINSDGGFVLILTLMKMIEATQIKTIDEIINQVNKVEVKQEIKEEVKTVVTEAKEEVQTIPFKEEFIETKIEEPTLEDKILAESTTVVDLSVIDAIESVESVDYSTPFDELPTSPIAVTKIETSEVISPEVKEEIKVEVKEEVKEEIQEELEIEAIHEEIKIDPNIDVEVVPTQEIEETQENELYAKLTAKVYDRDYSLGECFEKNFIFDGHADNKLHIISYAQDDDRKFLYKHFALIRTFAQDVFGHEIELEFSKGEVETQKKNDEIKQVDINNDKNENNNQENLTKESSNSSNSTGSMIEDVEMGSGCVADMQKTANPTPSQKELELNDILNSQQVKITKELFQATKVTVKVRS